MCPQKNTNFIVHGEHDFNDLIQRHGQEIVARLRRILDHPDHMDDVFQETMCQACASIPSLRDKNKFVAWFSSIATKVYSGMKRDHVFAEKAYENYFEEKRFSTQALSEVGPEQKAVLKNDCQIAYDIWQSIPVEDREIYWLYEVEGHTIAEIAKITHKPERTVKYRLARARKFVSEKVKKPLIAFLALRLLQPDDSGTWNRVYAHWQATTEIALSETASTVMEAVADNTAQVADTATVTAGATATTVSLLSSIMMTFAIPFVWGISVLLGGQAYGMALVYNAPTISMRRWITKHLFYCYCAIIIAPITLLILIRVTDHIFGWETRGIFAFGYIICCMLVAYIYLRKVNRHYQKLESGQIAITPNQGYLRRFLCRGFVGLTVLLLVFIVSFVKIGILQDYQLSIDSGEHNRGEFIILATTVLVTGIIIVHTGMIFLFRHILSISTDSSMKYPLPTITHSLPYRILRETPYMAVFVILTMSPAFLHLCLVNTRPICSVLELIGCSLCWCGALSVNIKKPGSRWRIIALTFCVLMAVLAILRLTIYE